MDSAYMIEVAEGRIQAGNQTGVDALFSAAANHPGPVVIHFHGGLVSSGVAETGATATMPFYRDAGAFPIFPIWKTGPFEVLPEVIARIAGEGLFRILLDRVVGFAHSHVMNAVGARGATIIRTLPPVNTNELAKSSESEKGDFRAEFINTNEFTRLRGQDDLELTLLEKRSIERSLEQDQELLAEIDAILNGAGLPVDDGTRSASALPVASAPKTSVADRKFLESFRNEANSRGFGLQTGIEVVKIIGRVIHRFIQRKDHGLHATAVEEILRSVYGSYVGTLAWSVMKDYTVTAAAEGGATLLILDQIARKLPDKRVLLVGHSAGAIFISHLLRAAAEHTPNLRFEVVLLAPAVRTDTFAEEFIPNSHLLATHGTGLCFRAFTMSEALECKDTLIRNVPQLGDLTWFYPRSLLYLISGILEGTEEDAPLLGMQRFHAPEVWNADVPHVRACREFLQQPGHVCYGINDGSDAKMRTNSTSHGSFGSFSPDAGGVPTNTTMVSVASLIQLGW